MSFVLDASVTLSWCFCDESTPLTVSLLEKLENEQAFVPAIWSLEVGNILVAAQRKKRISYAKVKEFLSLIEALSIQVDPETHHRAFQGILSLAQAENLTTYDAAYLELAMRLGYPLATKDRQLYEAALGLGVQVFSESNSGPR